MGQVPRLYLSQLCKVFIPLSVDEAKAGKQRAAAQIQQLAGGKSGIQMALWKAPKATVLPPCAARIQGLRLEFS